jgi:hypothetical protein
MSLGWIVAIVLGVIIAAAASYYVVVMWQMTFRG